MNASTDDGTLDHLGAGGTSLTDLGSRVATVTHEHACNLGDAGPSCECSCSS